MLNSTDNQSLNHPTKMIRLSASITTRFLCQLVIGAITTFLVLGNLSRIVSLPGFSNNLPIVSFILYGACIVFAILHRRTLTVALRAWPIYIIIIASCFYGTLKNGAETTPIFYAIRLILLTFSSLTSAHIFHRLYGNNLSQVLHILAKIYMAVVIAGFLIYFLFPDSIQLWQMLSQVGIVFNGDPHQRRFYSTYFDPNFYSVIACLPLLICILLYQTSLKIKYIGYSAILILSLFLAGSRSGIATLAFVILMLLVEQIFLSRRIVLRRRTIGLIGFGIVCFVFLIPLYADNIAVLLTRFSGISDDQSALLRVTSFENGLQILQGAPLLGIGYNYLTVAFRQYSILSSVDSSLLSTAINFGIIATAIFLLVCFFGLNRLYKKVKLKTNSPKLASRFTRHLIFYIWFVILFSSQFNNILYYEFWLLPVVMLIGYLNIIGTVKTSYGLKV